MKRLVLTTAGVLATIGLAGLVGADAPSPTIKQAMAKLHKGATAALPSLKKALGEGSPDWKGIKTTATLISELSAAITDQSPPKGDKANYMTLSKAYASTASDLKEAAEKEDLTAAKAALGKLQGSCMTCHKAHKK